MDENRTDNTNYEPNFIMTDPDESGAAAAGGAAGTDAAAVPLGALPHPDGPGGLLRCGGGDSGFRISCAGGRRG